jgi:hypothetical protein
MPAEHVKNIELALSYMRDARRSVVKKLATGSKSNGHQRGTTDDNMDRLVGYQRVINSLLEAREDEVGLPPSDTAVQGESEYADPPVRRRGGRIGRCVVVVLVDGVSIVIATGSLAGKVSLSASSSILSRCVAPGSLLRSVFLFLTALPFGRGARINILS